MAHKYLKYNSLIILMMLFSILSAENLFAQSSEEITVTGIVRESGTGNPLNQVFVSVSNTGYLAGSDEEGQFSVQVTDLRSELVFDLPGYTKRSIYLNGNDFVEIFLVKSEFRSMDDLFYTPMGLMQIKDAVSPFSSVDAQEFNFTQNSSFDQNLIGRIPGLKAIRQSGMPGQRTYMTIRGIKSIFADTEPLMFIDGMMHDYSYANLSMMEGFANNPMDVIETQDITDISVLKGDLSYLGSAGSNGVVYLNTEQQAEASTIIQLSLYSGLSFAPQKLDVLNAEQYNQYFSELLTNQGYSQTDIDNAFPWLNGNASVNEYYRYNNNTDWQSEIYNQASISNFHFFIKGGDDIATYNISTGYLHHDGVYSQSNFNRFNLRVNGNVNITQRVSITPNVKLALSNATLANHGPSAWKNPLLSALLKPQTMAPMAKDNTSGVDLPYFDDIGVYNTSNPSALVENAQGNNRNYQFLSSMNTKFFITDNLVIQSLFGLNYNNVRESLFLPDLGVVQVDSAYNSPGDFVNEHRSFQNHSDITWNKALLTGHTIVVTGGFRYMGNSYKNNTSIDLNTPSDDFQRLGQGSQFSYLRTTTGEDIGFKWLSFYGNTYYDFKNRFILTANLSYDGNSAINANNRYNFYPSVGGAWRISSERFLINTSWLEDLKMRVSWAQTGNIFSRVYDQSNLYYTSRRMNNLGVLLRQGIPNENLEVERQETMGAGLDISLFRQLFNASLDVYQSNVNNLILYQQLPSSLGYTDYFDNGGKLQARGIELGLNSRIHFGELIWTFGASLTNENTVITGLEFLNPDVNSLITSVGDAQYITSVDNPVNAFYGYKTNGLTTSGNAAQVIGPGGAPLMEGDMRFVDTNGDNVIDEADKMIIGDPNPDFYGYAFTDFKFRNFELKAVFNYMIGNDVYNYVRHQGESMSSYNNQLVTVLDRWNGESSGELMPRAVYGDPAGNAVFSDRWIEDGSFVRLSQLTLSYEFQPGHGIFTKGMVVYVTGSNLFTLTSYSGYDPEFMHLNNPFYMGIDYGKIPQTRSFITGIKLNL